MADPLLDGLNPQQLRAVTVGDGPVLVLAGPGSGKTRVLTRRLAYLIDRMQVSAFDIIAVTFTNKAAREMENRVANLVRTSTTGLWLGTFHAMCARLLRREAKALPFNENFVIFDSDDQEALVKRAIRELNIDEKTHRPAGVHAAISNAKNELLGPNEMLVVTYRDEVVKRVYARYQELLQVNNAVDFDDLLFYATQLLRDHPMLKENYARRFRYVLVDEFQDTNLAQYELLKQLSSYHKNIFVVGDEDQSIYRWRGADYRNVLRFEKDFPDCEKILLEQNYRSTQVVLDAARNVIDINRNRTPKDLRTDRGAGTKILEFVATDDAAEADYVVKTIQDALRRKTAKASDFAVMYRTNAQSRVIEEAFMRVGLPYQLVGAQRFYGRREVKDMIAFLRLVQNPDDEVSLLRVIGVPPRGIGDKSIGAIQAAAFKEGISAGRVVLDLGQKMDASTYWPLIGRSAAIVSDFGNLLNDWIAIRDQTSLGSLFDRIVQDTGFEKYINDGTDEGADRWDNVLELRRLAFDYQEKGLTAFLESLALVSDQDTMRETEEEAAARAEHGAVTLLTLHAAKGLEFRQVFIIGLDEGLLPHSRSRDDPEEMAEERRLFYVGITRTKDQLYLLRAERRSNFGMMDYPEPSRFLENINPALIRREGSRSSSRRETRDWETRWSPPRSSSSSSWSTSTPASSQRTNWHDAAPKDTRFKAGMRVRNDNWGEGIVLESKIDSDGEEIVTVHFDSVGLKRLIASLAKLETIN
jgi:DNA helicase-2/ATP-dependent DNA helicase PcrA